MLKALVLLCSGNDGLQTDRGLSRPDGVCLTHGMKEGAKHPLPGEQLRQGGLRPQKRAPDYPLVLAWGVFMLFIGAGAFALGMAIHNEALAKQPTPRPKSIYYCGTGVEMPMYEPCNDKGSERYLMNTSNQTFLVMDAWSPAAPFTTRHETKALVLMSPGVSRPPIRAYKPYALKRQPNLLAMASLHRAT